MLRMLRLTLGVLTAGCLEPVWPDMGLVELAPEACAPDVWCWKRGRPLMVKESQGAVYAVGLPGTLLVWNPASGSWVRHTLDTREEILDALIRSPDDLRAIDGALDGFRLAGG